ncbi:hypothetical protein AUJ14_02935 [Candidatus Micrarchaeota archaeon CG1_02_55_22]|nr:MAG: hypothetical protein AUJ14_02935 [Candidatus Micrarchaeota archaeon CG1_02_55_22]
MKRIRETLHTRRINAFRKRLKDLRYAPLSSLPLSEDFAAGLKFLRAGVYRHSSGVYLKLGGTLEKIFRQPFRQMDPVHYDPAISFSPEEYGSRANAVQAATLHARFYRRLIKDGVMHPRTQVILHDFKGAPSLIVLQPELEIRGSRFLGVMEEHQHKLLTKIREKYPGFEELRHEDLLDDLNYGRVRLPKNGPAPLHHIRSAAWYLHDLHLFNEPHSRATLDWIEKTLSENSDTG